MLESKIRGLLKAQNKLVKDLCNHIDMSDTALRKIYSRNSCEVSTLVKIADFFNVPPSYFFAQQDEVNDNAVINNLTYRLRNTANWLIYRGIAENDKDLANILGYTKSSFIQIMSGRAPLSDQFVDKLCSLDSNINKVYITHGMGTLLKSKEPAHDNEKTSLEISHSERLLRLVEKQHELTERYLNAIKKRDEQLDKLLTILTKIYEK